MATHPDETPKWAVTPYGGDEAAWAEAKAQARGVLLRWAARHEPGTYTDLAREVTAIAWPEGAFTHHGQQMGVLLGQVSMDELDRASDIPLLSALVIGRDEGMPSSGYWAMCRELGLPVPVGDLARIEAWYREFDRACAYWGPRAATG